VCGRFSRSPTEVTMIRWCLGLFALASVLASTVSGQAPATQSSIEREFLSRVRRLTVEGRRAGEGYWAPNGQSLVFQSEREPGNPFYQIYRLNMATGAATRISPGLGKTTCSFINPVTDDVLFASTHHDAVPSNSRTRSWPFVPRARSGATRGTTTRRWSSTSGPRPRERCVA
jgi:Tol biopolymer transport system component